MPENAPVMDVAGSQASPAAAPLRLGAPGSYFRWLLPILLCAGVLGLALLVVVFIPLRQAAEMEPDPVVQAVLADNLFLLQIRMWSILLTAVLVGGAMTVAGARQSAKALVRLELRLRRIADGESELPPTDPARDFAQFDEVFAGLRAAMDRAGRRNLNVLQQAHRSLGSLSQQIAAGKITPEEIRKSLSPVLNDLDAAVQPPSRAVAAKLRM